MQIKKKNEGTDNCSCNSMQHILLLENVISKFLGFVTILPSLETFQNFGQ